MEQERFANPRTYRSRLAETRLTPILEWLRLCGTAERAVFEWSMRIPCVQSCEGDGSRGLVVQLNRRPGKDDLWQLLALCHRYGVDMKQLAKFETAKNRPWFRDPQKYWYQAVFGKKPR